MQLKTCLCWGLWAATTLVGNGASAAPAPAADLPPLEEDCSNAEGGYGPFDYTDPIKRRDNLKVVETYHFNADVARLKQGVSGTLAGDIDYTIRAFPNHHRALDALSRLGVQMRSAKPPGTRCSIDGYFRRAISFKPNDATLYMVYGIHLTRWGKPADALEAFKVAQKLSPDEPNILYNLGLGYLGVKDYDRAREYGVKAYEQGFPSTITGLKDKLTALGKWTPK